MIIDSHAHDTNNCYKKLCRYLTRNADIGYFIEPGMRITSCEEIFQFCARHPGRIFPAIDLP